MRKEGENMKKGVLNYSITWTEDGIFHEEVFYTKLETVREYLNMLSQTGRGISSLKVWERPKAFIPDRDITSRINEFLNS